MIAVYVAIFGYLTWLQQDRFATPGYDLSIYGQATWLMSRFHRPFMTVRGYPFFGHHVNGIMLLFVPLFWLGAGPHLLQLVQCVWIAVGAVPLWFLGRTYLKDEWSALVVPGAYLLYPAVEWITWWEFHPDALAITPLLFAWWFATEQRWRPFTICIVIALLCKEDAALAVAVMGLLVARRHDRRVGAVTAAVGAAWYLACVLVIIPWADGGQAPFYAAYYPGLGTGFASVAFNSVRHPSRIHRILAFRPRQTYLRQLIVPVAFLPFEALGLLAIAGPQFFANLTGGGLTNVYSGTYTIKYHYSALIVVGVFLATCEALGQWRQPRGRAFVVGVLAAATLACNVAWAPSPIGVHFRDGEWALRPPPNEAALKAVLRMVPANVGVAASPTLVTHLDHRDVIYQFPDPYQTPAIWAIPLHPENDSRVDLLVIDRVQLGQWQGLFERLTGPSGQYHIVSDRDGVVVAEHVRDAGGSKRSPPGRSGAFLTPGSLLNS